MNLWERLCRETQDGQVMVESSDKMWSTGEGNANHFSILALRTPWTVWKGKKDRTLKDKLTRSVGAQYTTGDQGRNNSRKNEETKSKQKQHPVMDITSDGSEVQCYKGQYCIGTWNVSFMNQGKLEVVKQDGKSECQHSRNQQTKVDWNGWI